MRTATTSMVILAALTMVGCKSTGFLAKREAEKCCPTDIRKTVPWCAGEDALFQCPCEPSAAFYGYKPTCWRTWPTNGASWRDIHCGNEHHKAVTTELIHQNSELIALPTLESLPESTPEPVADQEATETDESSNIKLEESIKIDVVPTAPIQPKIKIEPPLEESPEIEAPVVNDLPRPTLGPIPLPPIDDE